jgi:hypothetical protein
MNKIVIIVTVVGVIALATMMSTIVTPDILADSENDRKNRVFDKHVDAGGKHGEKSQVIKDGSNADRSEDHREDEQYRVL